MDQRSPQELLAAWLAGEIDPESTRRLLKLCQQQPEFLDKVAHLKSIDRLLRVAMLDAGSEAFVQEVAARCEAIDSGDNIVSGVHWRLRWRQWVGLAAAACLVLGVAVGFWWQLQPVAVVARLESAQWREGERALQLGDKLGRGRFAIDGGFVALRFNRGAELLVEGPAEFRLISPDLVRFKTGSAFAHVPEGAIGFTVEGPTGRVVDRGTDFGVHIGEKGMEVHVLKGLVEAGRGPTLRPVRENEALQMSAQAVSTIPADAGRFLTKLPPPVTQPIGWVHWAFDENEGELTKSTSAGLDSSDQPARLLTLDNASPGPQWTNGQFGSALSFDGEDDYVQTDFPGIGGSAARTVAFWVKVPRDFQPKNSYAIICWGSAQELTEGWQISINPKEDEGPLGRLRVARIGGPVIGSTDLRDDRWHHVAVVFYGGRNETVPSTQVLMYIDGELERTVRKGMLNVRTDTIGSNSRKVAFGLNMGPANPNPNRPHTWRVFRGCLDEVFICDAALSQTQVRALMTRNHVEAFAPMQKP